MPLLRTTLIAAVLALVLAGCGGSSSCPSGDCTPYPTYQACYNDHHNVENFPVQKAIEICCIDHPIGSNKMNVVCGTTAQSCETYVTANLMDPNDPNLASDITAACTSYVVDRGP